MKINKSALKYIVLQRTEYLKNNLLYRLLSKVPNKIPSYTGIILGIKCYLFEKGIKKEFVEDIQADYENIKNFLPKNTQEILDIGCGMAGVDVFLSEHYQHLINIHLLDKTQVDENVYYGYESQTAFYNSLPVAKKLLIENSVPGEKIFLHDADNPATCFNGRKFDLITSFISWGFHYPVKTYLNEVVSSLGEGGVLIVDLRKDTDGLKEIQKAFNRTKIIFDTEKFVRICAEK
jgi:SAM-dependent methyltransferase